MVRWVFRPYTQVWRTICTSVSLRASTWVSPGFTLLKRSSPSFGSYQICSCSNPSPEDQGRLMLQFSWHLLLSFLVRSGFSTLTLAYWVDSLVRVSRRVSRSHFDKIARKRIPQTRTQLRSEARNLEKSVFFQLYSCLQIWFCLLRMRCKPQLPLG